VRVTLYSAENFSGRAETFAAGSSNLGNTGIGAQTVSAVRVFSTTVVSTPLVIFPQNGAVFSSTQSVDLVGRDAGGGLEFQSRLQTLSTTLTQTWQASPAWIVSNLAEGIYSLTLRAGNLFTNSAWSQPVTFTVREGVPPTVTVTAPYSDTLEGAASHEWTATGMWHLTASAAHSDSQSWWYGQEVTATYANGSPNFGDLTSPIITLPVSTEPYFIQFWQRYETEGQQPYWDRRLVQISVDGKPFSSTYQLYDDPPRNWLSVRLDLSPYYSATITHTLQLRFHFSSLDDFANGFAGWYIDDVQVSAAPPPACGDIHEPDGKISQATMITYTQTISAEICPGGDYDYYAFFGAGGDDIIADVDAQDYDSPLDAVLVLLDADGNAVLAESDDEILHTRLDPHLGYTLPRSGRYYLRIQAWDHPMGSGVYSLTLLTDNQPPTLTITSPHAGDILPPEVITITAAVTDSIGGISRVEFYWHSPDWEEDTPWQLLSTDREAADGWSTQFDAAAHYTTGQIMFYAAAYDWAGNRDGDFLWPLGVGYRIYLPVTIR
jgi:hypothetical protein